MITITFPDGKKKEYKKGTTALDIAKGISEGLAREVLAAKVNGEVVDAFRPIEKDASLELLKFKDPEGKDVFWHSASHLMTQAVLRVFKDQNVGLGVGFPVEEGFYQDYDMNPLHPDDLKKIEDEMKKIVSEKLEVTHKVLTKKEALAFYKDDPYKIELVKAVPDEMVSFYCQGEFDNLCKGPHVPNTGVLKAVKLLKVAGAYWRGDSKNKQLQRIYGIAFPDKKDLRKHLHMLEEAKKRDHRVLGKKMGLISFHEESPGAIFYQPKGTIIFRELQEFVREQYRQRGFSEVITPLVYDKSLWETSGHWEHYHENMFVFEVDGKTVSLKPMNCPSHCLMFGESIKSYRELPLRIADFASLHRNELRGVLGGMTRVRKFNQDDSHIFCTPEQLNQEIHNELDFAKFIYEDTFNFEYHLELSTRPEKSMGTDKQWELAEAALKSALDDKKLPYVVNEGDGAFYGPKIDLHIKDCIGRNWQLATIQVDFQLPQRFGLVYESKEGKRETPIIVHRAMLGTLDRFMGILIEQYAGKFPLWLNPEQVRIVPVAPTFNAYAEEVKKELFAAGLRVEVDDSHETMNKKIRTAQLDYVNYILVVGDKEKSEKSVNIRTRDNQVHGMKKVSDFCKELVDEVKNRK